MRVSAFFIFVLILIALTCPFQLHMISDYSVLPCPVLDHFVSPCPGPAGLLYSILLWLACSDSPSLGLDVALPCAGLSCELWIHGFSRVALLFLVPVATNLELVFIPLHGTCWYHSSTWSGQRDWYSGRGPLVYLMMS